LVSFKGGSVLPLAHCKLDYLTSVSFVGDIDS